MAETNTPNYNLIKPDPLDFYDVRKFNENADLIDAELKNINEDAATHKAERASLTEVGHTQLSNSVTSTSESLSATPFAVKTAMDRADAAFLQANNGKTDIASVIGSPATASNTFAQLKTHIQNAKNKGATNLTAKGTTASGTESLDSLMAKIASVSTGKKYAIRTANSSSVTTQFVSVDGATNSRYFVKVTGLNFTPRTVMIVEVASTIGTATSCTKESGLDIFGFYRVFIDSTADRLTGNAYFEDGGFQLPALRANTAYTCIAIE